MFIELNCAQCEHKTGVLSIDCLSSNCKTNVTVIARISAYICLYNRKRFKEASTMQFLAKLLPVSHMKMIIICLGGAGLLVFASFVTNQVRRVEVVVAANGKEETVQTHAHTVEELIDEIGIAVGKHDELSPDLDTPIEAGMNITYKTANKVIVNIDDAKKTYY